MHETPALGTGSVSGKGGCSKYKSSESLEHVGAGQYEVLVVLARVELALQVSLMCGCVVAGDSARDQTVLS